MQNSFDIRNAFLNFFREKDHKIMRSGNLITDDKSLLFTNSGMVPFKKYFLNEETPADLAMTSAQKSLRVSGKHNDLDQVGFTKRHHTFFEMLGNFSFGKYFKEEAIFYAWEFLTKVLCLDPKRLYITVFSEDQEAFNIWKKLTNFEDSKIIKISTSDNFWSMGDTGPCGPCSEIFYDHGDKYEGDIPGSGNELDRYIEIWNLVFMQKNKIAEGKMSDLEKQCIDTGMGLERITAVMNGTPDNYETDLFSRILEASFEILGGNDKKNPAYRVIADHIRSSCFLLSEGLLPSNEGRGYVLRRIIRRAVNYMYKINKNKFLYEIGDFFINDFSNAYPELAHNKDFILTSIENEEKLFKDSYFNGFKILDQELAKTKFISGDFAFKLYDTYGFPIDVTCNIVESRQGEIDITKFEELMQNQKILSKQGLHMLQSDMDFRDIFSKAKENNLKLPETDFVGYDSYNEDSHVVAIFSEGDFVKTLQEGNSGVVVFDKTVFYGESGGQLSDKGGIYAESFSGHITSVKKQDGVFFHFIDVKNGNINVGDIISMKNDIYSRKLTAANHTATHILHKLLREELGTFVTQHGSMVSSDKLRFDFNYHKPIEKELLFKIEKRINDLIVMDLPVTTDVENYDDAVKNGAMALFGEKYTSKVRVVSVADDDGNTNFISKELCGGTHVKSTSSIGGFKIISEGSIASGIRRIEAITSVGIFDYLSSIEEDMRQICSLVGGNIKSAIPKVESLVSENQKLLSENNNFKISKTIDSVKRTTISDIDIVFSLVEKFEPKTARLISDRCLQKFKSGSIIVIANQNETKISVSVALTKDLQSKMDAKKILLKIIENFGCTACGGRSDFAQGGVNMANVENQIAEMLCCDTNGISERENNFFEIIKKSIF